ncbi:MAG: O-antigen ligase family protein [Coriobacteriales bacterium]|nr:O-antigen ligase family protein [Coriobacteriales bacterium]
MFQLVVVRPYQKVLSWLLDILTFLPRLMPRFLRRILALVAACACMGILVYSVYLGNVQMERNRMLFMGAFALLTLFMADKRMESQRWPAWIVIPWLLIALSMLLAFIMFRDAEYLCGAIMALVQLPAFWLVVGSRDDHGDTTGTLALAATLLFCAILVLSVLGHPIGNGRYSGIMDNANTFAFVLLPCLPFLLWAVSSCYRQWQRVLCFILAACDLALLFFCGSRSALIATVLILIVWLWVDWREAEHRRLRTLLRDTLGLAATTVAAALLLFYASGLGANASTAPIHSAVAESLQLTQDVDLEFQENASGNDFLESCREILEHLGLGSEGGDFSNDRLRIWRAYWEAMGPLGHDVDDPFRDSLGPGANTAHNAALQVSYDFGVVAGCAFLLLQLMVPLCLLLGLWHYRRDMDEKGLALFCAAALTIAFAVIMLVEGIYKPFVNLLPWLAACAIMPGYLLAKRED